MGQKNQASPENHYAQMWSIGMNRLILIFFICAIASGCSNTVYTATFEFSKKRCEKNGGLIYLWTANNKEVVQSFCADGAVFNDSEVAYK